MIQSNWYFIGLDKRGPFLWARWVIPYGTDGYLNAPMDYVMN